MVADGTDNTKPDVQKAVQAGTDLSHGSDQAYDALMREVSTAQQAFGNDTAGFNKYGQAVADGLKQSGTIEEMAEHFAKSDMYQLAHSDGKHLKADDLNPMFGTNALEAAFIKSLHDNYGDLQARAGTTFLGNTKDKFDDKDLSKVLASRQHDRDGIEQTRLAGLAAQREQDKFARVTGDLFANDGNPHHSLYAVLDGIKTGDGKTDGKISRSDLRRYQQDYAVRASQGSPGFTPENLETVRTLDREWDKPLGVALRGTTTRPMGHGEEQETNWNINLDAAGRAMHIPSEQLFAAYAPPGSQTSMTNVDAAAAGPNGPAALPRVDQAMPGANGFDQDGRPLVAGAPQGDVGAGAAAPRTLPVGADGRPLAAPVQTQPGAGGYDAMGNLIGSGPAPGDAGAARAPATVPVGADGRPLTAPVQTQPGAGGYDAMGNLIGSGPAPGDAGAARAPATVPVGADGRPLTAPVQTQPGAGGYDAMGNLIGSGPAPGDAGAARLPATVPVGADGKPLTASTPRGAAGPRGDGSAYDDYYGARSPASTDAGPAAPARRPRPAGAGPAGADNTGAAPPVDNTGAGAARPAESSPRAGAMVDIEHAPPLPVPNIKPGDDLNKIKADFQTAAIAHFSAGAIYTVKPGQGWDRVARDTMRKSGEDASDESKVEALSDNIAKLNGWSGRLDKSKMLQPGQQVQVRDIDWVKAQVKNAVDNLGTVTDAAKPPGSAAAPLATDQPDFFGANRNMLPADTVKTDATPPAGTVKTDATPPAGTVKTDATPPAGTVKRDVTPPAGTVKTEATPPPDGPPAIPKLGADGKPVPPATLPVSDGTPPGAVDKSGATQASLDAAEARRKAIAAGNAGTTPGDVVPDIYSNPLKS